MLPPLGFRTHLGFPPDFIGLGIRVWYFPLGVLVLRGCYLAAALEAEFTLHILRLRHPLCCV